MGSDSKLNVGILYKAMSCLPNPSQHEGPTFKFVYSYSEREYVEIEFEKNGSLKPLSGWDLTEYVDVYK